MVFLLALLIHFYFRSFLLVAFTITFVPYTMSNGVPPQGLLLCFLLSLDQFYESSVLLAISLDLPLDNKNFHFFWTFLRNIASSPLLSPLPLVILLNGWKKETAPWFSSSG